MASRQRTSPKPAPARADRPSGADGGSGRPSETDVSEERQAELEDLAKAFKHLFRGLRRLRGRDTHATGPEVTHAQFELLIELYKRGPLSAGELASAAQLTPATVTQMLDHLSTNGHVERTRSEEDRRIVVISLTRLGKRKVNAKRALWQSRWRQALDGMDANELRAATEVLVRLGAMFDDEPAVCG
jgi:DNA-binding MarR family transcriptional regulator